LIPAELEAAARQAATARVPDDDEEATPPLAGAAEVTVAGGRRLDGAAAAAAGVPLPAAECGAEWGTECSPGSPSSLPPSASSARGLTGRASEPPPNGGTGSRKLSWNPKAIFD